MSTTSSVALAAVVAVTLQLIRLSVDLIRVASITPPTAPNKKDKDKEKSPTEGGNGTDEKKQSDHSSKNPLVKHASTMSSYGSVVVVGGGGGGGATTTTDEAKSLLNDEEESPEQSVVPSDTSCFNLPVFTRFVLFLCGWCLLSLLFIGTLLLSKDGPPIFPNSLLVATLITMVVEIICLTLDKDRLRYGAFDRIVRLMALLILWGTYTAIFLHFWKNQGDDDEGHHGMVAVSNKILLGTVTGAVVWALSDGWMAQAHPTPARRQSITEAASKPSLSREAVITLIKPYFWPDATSETAFWNRVRAIATWLCVILSKACNLVTPLLIGAASTALAHQDYASTIRYSIWYAILRWFGSAFKEGQSLVYLKVAQAAFVQLSEASFDHLHHLSLDWHLRKKLGEVLRSVDRGVQACDTLMKYLFLWLVPALAECFMVTVIFATYFKFFPLAVTVFYFVFIYVVWTILVTLWRKKFRKALVKHDNEWHDLFTDSMVNFETVKFFTAENYEKERFRDAVDRYQTGSVHVQGSLSFLNLSQKFLMETCMAAALSLAAWGIHTRVSCCVQVAGCDSGISQCCQNVSSDTCPGMQVGDFVAVLTYIGDLFGPLNFLGSVYNAVVMAMIDINNLSEILAENPDVSDAPDAFELPRTNVSEPEIAVEFDNVYFHYPTQPEGNGLQGLSFKMKRGTTTAIVGPTGAGKTTISRLLFRFYDVLGGAVKVNGVDVRSVTQTSLRGAMGVVPQAASMFNDTIRSNLLYGRRDATEEELIQATKDAQLLDFIETLNDGWETMVGDRGLKLSGGEKQRAAIARCLLKDPPFVLLDEATSALDSLTESSVQEALDRLGAERTVLVIAHRLGTVRNADNIIVLKHGKVVEQGTHDELLLKGGVYADMWNKQLHSASTSTSQVDLLAAPEDNSPLSIS